MKPIKSLLALTGLTCALSAHAVTTVVTDTLARLGGNPVGASIFDAYTTTEVDYIPFYVAGNGLLVEIDVKSYERSDVAPFGEQDINGDGLIAYIDPTIYLFRNDGALDITDFTGQASEFSFDTFADGSISFLDPYLRLDGVLNKGHYVLAVGSADLSLTSAIAGVNTTGIGPIGLDDTVAAVGAYQVTISVVPEAGSGLMLAAGLAGIAGRVAQRRRRQPVAG